MPVDGMLNVCDPASKLIEPRVDAGVRGPNAVVATVMLAADAEADAAIKAMAESNLSEVFKVKILIVVKVNGKRGAQYNLAISANVSSGIPSDYSGA